MVQKCIVHKKIIKCQRNLFSTKLKVLKWCGNRSRSPGFDLVVLCPTLSEISRFFFTSKHAILISTLWKFYWGKKKLSYTLKVQLGNTKLYYGLVNVPIFMLHITYLGLLMLFNCIVLSRVPSLETNKQYFGKTW